MWLSVLILFPSHNMLIFFVLKFSFFFFAVPETWFIFPFNSWNEIFLQHNNHPMYNLPLSKTLRFHTVKRLFHNWRIYDQAFLGHIWSLFSCFNMCSFWIFSAIENLYVKNNHFMYSLVEAFQWHERVRPPLLQYSLLVSSSRRCWEGVWVLRQNEIRIC